MLSPGRVLLIGLDDHSGLAPLLRRQPWLRVLTTSLPEALRHIRQMPELDLLVLHPGGDLEGHLELCRTVKFDSRTSFVSVVVLLGPEHARRQEDVLDGGADDCIRLDVSERELLLRLQKALRSKQAADTLDDSAAVLTALANAVEGKDLYTCGHVERVGAYAVNIGRAVGVDSAGLEALRIGGVVHDIGKIGVPDQILNKPGKLTPEEMAVIHRHPVIGYEILKPLRTFRDVLPIVRWHHEKPNGRGYPDGIGGSDLPVLPRIIAVADVFDALSTDRPYRKALELPECRRIMIDMAAKGDLDDALVQALHRGLDHDSVAMLRLDAA